MDLPRASEVVIIGGGVSGLSVALPIARAGVSVVVVDRGDPWSDASGANAGTLSIQVKRSEVLTLVHESIQRWQRMPDEYGVEVGFGQPGGIRVATTAAECVQLEKSVEVQQSNGIDVQMLDRQALMQLGPWFGPNVKAGGFCIHDSYSNPLLAGNAMITAAGQLGAVIAGGNCVTQIKRDKKSGEGRFSIKTANGDTIRANHVVNAAGAWAGEIASLAGASLPVKVDVNMLTVTEPAPPLFDRVVTHVKGILSLKQLPNGTCLIGGGWQGRGSVTSGKKDIDYEHLLHNLRIAANVIPRLKDLHIIRTWAGFEAVAPDALPIMGRLGEDDHVWVLACARGGYSLAPALGARLAEMILDPTKYDAFPEFSPQRFMT
ncbi:MAG TPA: hypothetical protein DHW07_06205 [Gammaproteobacteria bacterium]|nr:hypothetical protein [Gammaproteobacteria bacterium]